MVEFMKANIRKIKNMAREKLHFLMEEFLKASSWTGKCMEKVYTWKMVYLKKAFGIMEKD